MKVTVEGTAEELLGLAELLTLGKVAHHSGGICGNKDATPRPIRDAQTRDDVPNRFREEGVQ